MKIAVRFSIERIAAFDRAIRADEYPNARTIARRVGGRSPHRPARRRIPPRPARGPPRPSTSGGMATSTTEPDYRLPLLNAVGGRTGGDCSWPSRHSGSTGGRRTRRTWRGHSAKITAGLSETGHESTWPTSARVIRFARRRRRQVLTPGCFETLIAAIRNRRRLVHPLLLGVPRRGDGPRDRPVPPRLGRRPAGTWWASVTCAGRSPDVRPVAEFAPWSRPGRPSRRPDEFRIGDYLAGSLLRPARDADGEVPPRSA